MLNRLNLRVAGWILSLVALPWAATAQVQDWPNRPVQIVIPFPAGGGTDVITRTLAAKLQLRLDQPFLLVNMPGAGGILGTQKAAKAAPDGYTFVIGAINTIAIARTFYKHLPYDPIKDFSPVALLAAGPHVLVISPDSPGGSLQEYIDYVRKNKGRLSYASYGDGSTSHLISEMFKAQHGLDLVHVPYKGLPPALNDVIGNRVSMLISSSTPAIPYVQGGRLRALAVFGDKRINSLPDVPTMEELGFKDSAFTIWYALFAPAGTPPLIIERMNRELKAVLADKDVGEMFAKSGIYSSAMSVSEFSAFVQSEAERWGKLVQLSGAKGD